MIKVKIQGKKYKFRQSLNDIPVQVGIAIQDLLNVNAAPAIIVALWLKCEVHIIEQCDVNEITALYNIIIELMESCQCKINPKKFADLNSLTVEKYIDIDEAIQNNDNMISASLDIMKVLFKKMPRKISTGYAVCFFSYIMQWKQAYSNQYPDVFNQESADANDVKESSVAANWGWTNTLYSLCNSDIRQVNAWLHEPMSKLLVFLSWNNQKNIEELNKMQANGNK